MKKISFVCGQINNKIFDTDDPVMNRDNCLHSIHLLKSEFEKKGYDLSTPDINPIETSDFVIYVEMPKRLPKDTDIEKSFLIINECEVIRPANWNYKNHRFFHKIFTWHDDLIDNKKYFKTNFSQKILTIPNWYLPEKSKFCVSVIGNRVSNHSLELYSERVAATRWFEKNHPEQFDLYGVGWDNPFPALPPRISRICQPLFKTFGNKYPSYRGRTPNKNAVMKQYKFSICYENARDIPGYITEKIFDSFFAGCIPVYLGVPNITDYIPAGTFIDRRLFPSYEHLYYSMKFMDDDEYCRIIDNINRFLTGAAIYQFSSECFVRTIIRQVLGK